MKKRKSLSQKNAQLKLTVSKELEKKVQKMKSFTPPTIAKPIEMPQAE